MAPKRHAATSSPAPTTTKPLSSGPATLKANANAIEIAQYVLQQYLASTPQRTMLLDAFMGFLAVIAVVQFLYCVLGGNFVSFPLLFLSKPGFLCVLRVAGLVWLCYDGWANVYPETEIAIQRLPERFLCCCWSIRPHG